MVYIQTFSGFSPRALGGNIVIQYIKFQDLEVIVIKYIEFQDLNVRSYVQAIRENFL